MTAITDAEVAAAVEAVRKLPASNPGFISVVPETISNLISKDLTERIVRAALIAASQAREPKQLDLIPADYDQDSDTPPATDDRGGDGRREGGRSHSPVRCSDTPARLRARYAGPDDVQ